MAGILRNPKHELYAQARASGMSSKDAYTHATGKTTSGSSSYEKNSAIRGRINELLRAAANRAELSRKDILDRIFEDWELARKLGQVPAALKAAELMGKEMHKMFVERKEIGGAGDFDNKTEDELKAILRESLADLGWDEKDAPTIN